MQYDSFQHCKVGVWTVELWMTPSVSELWRTLSPAVYEPLRSARPPLELVLWPADFHLPNLELSSTKSTAVGSSPSWDGQSVHSWHPTSYSHWDIHSSKDSLSMHFLFSLHCSYLWLYIIQPVSIYLLGHSLWLWCYDQKRYTRVLLTLIMNGINC